MKGKIGQATRYTTRLPNQWKLERIVDLSKEAGRRLKWIDYYLKHKNARKTWKTSLILERQKVKRLLISKSS